MEVVGDNVVVAPQREIDPFIDVWIDLCELALGVDDSIPDRELHSTDMLDKV